MLLSSPRALLMLVAFSAGYCSLARCSSAPWPRPSSPSAAALAAWSRYAPADDALYSYLPHSLYAAAAAAAATSTPMSDFEDAHQTGSRFAAMARNAARRAVETAGGMSALHYPAAPRVQLVAPPTRAIKAVQTLAHNAHHHYTTSQSSSSKLGRSPVEGGVQLPASPAAGSDSTNGASSSPRTFSKSSAMSFGWIALAAIVSSRNFC